MKEFRHAGLPRRLVFAVIALAALAGCGTDSGAVPINATATSSTVVASTTAPTTALAPTTAPPTTPPPTVAPTTAPPVTAVTAAAPATTSAPAAASQPATDCPNGSYINSSGNSVCSPYASSGGPPAGATAQCNDGTYSMSQHRQGTCSGHGGVAQFL